MVERAKAATTFRAGHELSLFLIGRSDQDGLLRNPCQFYQGFFIYTPGQVLEDFIGHDNIEGIVVERQSVR